MKTTLFAVLLLGAATSAAARDTTLNVDDATPVGTLRFEVQTADHKPPIQPHGGVALELGFHSTSGESRQDIGAGERVSIGGVPASGPRQISNAATLRELDTFVRWRTSSNPWMLELFGGLSFFDYDFKAGFASSSASPTAATLGLGGLWQVRPRTSLHARYLAGKGVNSYSDDVRLDRLELAVVHAFGRNLAARVGYTVWDVTAQPSEPNSELHMRFRGPMFGFDLAF